MNAKLATRNLRNHANTFRRFAHARHVVRTTPSLHRNFNTGQPLPPYPLGVRAIREMRHIRQLMAGFRHD